MQFHGWDLRALWDQDQSYSTESWTNDKKGEGKEFQIKRFSGLGEERRV